MMPGLNDPRFEFCLDEFFDDFRAQKALHFQLLLNRSQGRIIKGAAGISSKPMTEQSSGTSRPDLVNARIAAQAVRSSKATRAVNRESRLISSSATRYASEYVELLPLRLPMRLGSSFRPTS